MKDLFEIKSYKKRFDANKVKLTENIGYPYIVRQSDNNGQKGFINENPEFLNDGNTISFGQDTATIFYQENSYFTGDKIKILHSKNNKFRKENALFFISAMNKAFSNFSWGSSRFDIETLESQKILLPTKNGEIDFEFMEKFITELESEHIKEIEEKSIVELEAYLTAAGLKDFILTDEEKFALENLNSCIWQKFLLKDLFEKISTIKLPYKAKDLPSYPVGENILPCLTSSFHNQGLNCFCPRKGATVLKNVISIPSNSDVYRAYYQANDFTVLSDAYAIFSKKELSAKQYLFMVACINKVTNLKIYSYKNKLGGWNVVKDKYILLPTKDGEIDYEFMKKFITAVQKITIADVVKYSEEKISAYRQAANK